MPSARQPATHASAEIRGGHTGHLRRANLERVQAFVMDHPGPFACAELMKATGLSAPTVGKLVKQLVQRGLVRDLGVGPSRGGRRPSLMEFNARYGFVAAISLGVAKTQLAVADLRGDTSRAPRAGDARGAGARGRAGVPRRLRCAAWPATSRSPGTGCSP